MAGREINLGFMSMRHASLPDRVAAAAEAGFDGISLHADYWQPLRDSGWDVPRIQALLDKHGMRVSEVEPLRFLREDLLQAADEIVRAFNVPRVQAVPPREGAVDFEVVARWLTKAAERLAPAQLAIEFLPPTGVPDAPVTQRLIDWVADSPAKDRLGLCVDAWHVFRGAGLASLKGMDPKRVFMIQINDGTMKPEMPDYFPDCRKFRRPVGEGEFDLKSFMAMLPESTPVNVEVINEELDRQAPRNVADRLYRSTVSLLERR
jgi:sugar phosphate isomerase/epimerase